jgi:hypothetical protein
MWDEEEAGFRDEEGCKRENVGHVGLKNGKEKCEGSFLKKLLIF